MSTALFARSSRIFVAWPFVLALLVLLLNDAALRYAYPGWLTGKLSDVAGLFVMAGIVLVIWPQRSGVLLVLTAALFTWWKSPQSQAFIDFMQAHGAPLGRVVDPTDLIALVALPLGALVLRPELHRPGTRAKPVAAALSAIFVMLALTGTSMVSMLRDFSIRNTDPAGHIDVDRAGAIVYGIARDFDLHRCTDSNDPYWVAYCGKRGVVMRYTALPQSHGIHFQLNGNPGSLVFGWGDSSRTLAGLQRQLQMRFGSAFPNLELVIDLSPNRYRAIPQPDPSSP